MTFPTDTAVGAMLSPALFMTATGSLLISSNNRLARVVDRLRALTEIVAEIRAGTRDAHRTERALDHYRETVRTQKRRGDLILRAITLLHGAFACFLGTSLTIAINVVAGDLVPGLATGVAILGVALLFGASIQMLREVRLGVKMLDGEARFLFEEDVIKS